MTLSELMATRCSQAEELRATAGERHVEDALADAVREHARFVFRVAYSVLRNREDAEDAVQETFLRTMRHPREFAVAENRRAWLARTAWRIAIDRTRKVKHISLDDETNEGLAATLAAMQAGDAAGSLSSHPTLTGKGAAPTKVLIGKSAAPEAWMGAGSFVADTEASLINDQMLRLLRSFIAALPADLRHVVTLSTVNEMTSAEMSAVLGIPEGSVRTRLLRARQLLKDKFMAVLERKTP
jgi:RNA polymerase sigma-70 factor (ECF subfamily)